MVLGCPTHVSYSKSKHAIGPSDYTLNSKDTVVFGKLQIAWQPSSSLRRRPYGMMLMLLLSLPWKPADWWWCPDTRERTMHAEVVVQQGGVVKRPLSCRTIEGRLTLIFLVDIISTMLCLTFYSLRYHNEDDDPFGEFA